MNKLVVDIKSLEIETQEFKKFKVFKHNKGL